MPWSSGIEEWIVRPREDMMETAGNAGNKWIQPEASEKT